MKAALKKMYDAIMYFCCILGIDLFYPFLSYENPPYELFPFSYFENLNNQSFKIHINYLKFLQIG